MKLFTEADLERYVKDRVETAVAIEVEKLRENHGWELRRANARADDAEADRKRYKTGYKNALRAMRELREEIELMKKRLADAGLPETTAAGGGDDDGEPKLNSVQSIMDAALGEIPGMDSMSQDLVRAYIERELRLRGAKAGADILAEVVAGDSID